MDELEAICFSLDGNSRPIFTYSLSEDQKLIGFANSTEFLLGQIRGKETVTACDVLTGRERLVCSLDEGEHIADYRESFDIYTTDGASFSSSANSIRSPVDGGRILRAERAVRLNRNSGLALTQHMAEHLNIPKSENCRQLFFDSQTKMTDECVVLKSISGRTIALERFPLGTIILTQFQPAGKRLSIAGWLVGTASRQCIVLDTMTGKRLHVDTRFNLTFFMDQHFLRLDSMAKSILLFSYETSDCVECFPLDGRFTRGVQSFDGNVVVLYDSLDNKRVVELLDFGNQPTA